MRQLPFILILVLSSGLLLWNFRRYDAIQAAERGLDEQVSGVDGAGLESRVAPGSRPGTGRTAVDLLGDEPLSRAESRVPLAAVQGPEVLIGPAPPPVDWPDEEEESADVELEEVVQRTPEGRVRAEGTTLDGEKHGRWTEWWGDDQRMSEGAWKNGQRHGLWTYWHENGQVKEQGAYKDGKLDGPWSWNYADGSLRLTLAYSDGRSDGVLREWGPEGNTLREGTFVDGEPDGRWVESHPDGTPRSETHYLNGLRHGPHRAWYSDGQLKEQGEYRAGLREGRWLFYDSEGRPDGVRSGYYELGSRRRP